MSDLRIVLFGRPQLETENGPVDLPNRKALALVAYLAIEAKPHSRDHLSGLLWPDYSQTRALANLRRTLWLLNQTQISPFLHATKETIAFAMGEGLQVDAREFQDQVALLKPPYTKDSALSLLASLERIEGDFLADFYIPDSELFEAWAGQQREYFRGQLLQVMSDLAEYFLEAQDFQVVQDLARRQIALDNYREGAYRQLMQALALSGQRSLALSQYEKLMEMLEKELGVEPEFATQSLVDAIRSDTLLPESARIEKIPPETPGEQSGKPSQLKPLELAPKPITAPEGRSPYRGLFAFREEDAPFFFGREAFSERLLEFIQTRSMVAVVGPSGSGKSSVVQAGLLAQLRKQQRWLITSFRPGGRPYQALASSLLPHLEPGLRETDHLIETNKLADALQKGDISLMDVVRRISERHPAGMRFPLVADQFEELYTLVPEQEIRDRFMDTLTDAIFDQYYRETPIFTLILTLRADFLGQALAHRPFADAIQESDVKLGPMTKEELKRAIVNPAKQLSVEFEPGLVPRILEDVSGEPGNLPMLEFALSMLWDQRREQRLTHDAYEAIERVEGALARHADKVFEGLEESQQEQARRIFTQVVRPGEGTEDTRRLATRDELDEQDWPLVQQMADARLLVTGRDSEGNETVEVVHEALIRGWGRLRGWLEADRAFRVWQERLRASIRSWQATDQDEGALLRGVALANAEGWFEERKRDISKAEIEFIHRSKDLDDRLERERERRRQRIVWGLAVGLVVATLLAISAVLGWNSARLASLEAEENATVSNSLALAANAQQMFDAGEGELALALALEAAKIQDPPAEVVRTLSEITLAPGSRLVLDDHKGWVNTFVLLPDGKTLISGGGRKFTRSGQPLRNAVDEFEADYSLRLWDIETGEQLLTMEGHTDSITEIVVTSDGQTAVSASVDGTLIVWDLSTGARKLQFEGHEGQVMRVFLNHDETQVLSLSHQWVSLDSVSNSSLIGWDLQTGEERYRLEHEPNHVRYVEVTPDGRTALLGISECNPEECHIGTAELLLFDVQTGEVIRSIDFERQTPSGVWNLDISPDGTFAIALVTNFPDQLSLEEVDLITVLRIDLSTGDVTEQSFFSEPADFPLISPNGQWIAGSMEFLSGFLAPLSDLSELRPLEGSGRFRHTSGVSDYAFNPDGTQFLTAGDDGSMIIWDVETGEPMLGFSDHPRLISRVEFTPDGKSIISSSLDGTIRIWALDFEVDTQDSETVTITDHTNNNLVYVDFSPDGRQLLSIGGDPPPENINEAVLWDVEEQQLVYRKDLPEFFRAQFGKITSVGEHAIIGGISSINQTDEFQGTLLLWDLRAGQIVERVDLEAALHFKHLAFHPDGGKFLTGSADGIMRLWDYSTLTVLSEYPNLSETDIYGVVFSPDGSFGLSTDAVGMITQWDLQSGDQVREFVHGGLTTSVTFSPEGSRFLSTSTDGALVLWDFETGEELQRLSGHTNGVSSAQFLPDGLRAISSAADGTLILWDLETGEILRVFAEHSEWIWRVALSPDGQLAASASEDGLVILRRAGGLNLDELIRFSHENRYVPEFTCEQREQFRIEPLCSLE